MISFFLENITTILLYGSISLGFSFFARNNFNKKLRTNFKKIAKELNFSYFLRDRNVFNLIAPPSISGVKNERAIDFTTGNFINTNFKISMVCGNRNDFFVIEPKKTWIGTLYKSKIIKTGHKEMDRYFRILSNNPNLIHDVFDKELMDYFILQRMNIQQSIKIVPNSINTIINLYHKEENMIDGSVERQVKFMIDLMERIAIRIENSANPPNQINARPTLFLE